jgi:ectoine hydroxylase-related dioxygenase (phytanoyl-CoA dioxygenase family)
MLFSKGKGQPPMNAGTQAQDVYPSNLQPMYEANELLADVRDADAAEKQAALRARLRTDGYLFFRNIVPRQSLLEVRDRITRILADIGWILDGDERMAARAIALPQREGEPGYFAALDRIVRLEELHSLAHEPRLLAVMRQVLGDSAFPHPLGITRLVFPNNPEITTPPHQDYRNNQGTANLTAAWIPLGDCPVEQGSLAILEGSHKAGLLPLQYHLGPGNRGAVLTPELLELRWVTADFKAGDILLFPSLTVHSALENRHPDAMRLSVDFRYQLEGEALTAGCLEPHFGRVSWEEIYQGWSSKELQYYWRDKHFEIVPWDSTMHRLPEDHIKDAIRQGNAYNKRRQQRHAENPLRNALAPSNPDQ